MQKHLTLSATALLAACALTLPLAAAPMNGAMHGSANAAGNNGVNGQQANRTTHTNAPEKADVHAGGEISHSDKTPEAGKVNPSVANRANAEVRSDFHAFSGRLDRIEVRLKVAEQKGRITAEEARRRQASLDKIRARFVKASDKAARKLNKAARKSLDAEIKAEEAETPEND